MRVCLILVKMEKNVMCIATFIAVVWFQACTGLEWTKHSLSGGATVTACVDEAVSLNWAFTTTATETVVNILWHTISEEGETILATYTDGHFFKSSATGLKVKFLPDAGLLLSNLTWSDFGTFRVTVKVEDNGVLKSRSRSVVLAPPDAPVLAEGRLVAEIVPYPVQSPSTRSLHVQLQCGIFLKMGNRPVSVMWTTPTGQEETSSDVANGRFLLTLSNPVQGGTYTCRLADPSVVSACVSTYKNMHFLKWGARVHVDESQARLSLLSAEMGSMTKRDEELESKLEAQRQADTAFFETDKKLMSELNDVAKEVDVQRERGEALTSDVARMRSEMNRLRTDYNQLRSEMSDLRTRNEAAHRVVAFHVRLSRDPVTFKSGKTLVYDDVRINIGGGYNKTTGHFTAPVSGVYAFFVNCMALVDATHFQEARILLEGMQLASCLSHRPGADIWDFGGAQVLVHMTAGQKIWMAHELGDVHARGGFWQMFSGFLLSAE